jgi:two-component system OmpR family response regulator
MIHNVLDGLQMMSGCGVYRVCSQTISGMARHGEGRSAIIRYKAAKWRYRGMRNDVCPPVNRSDFGMNEPHILFVDDDVEIRQLTSKFLRQSGFRVTPARDGREMREAMKSTQIDLVVLDLMLPGTSGLDLCRELRANSSIPIIILTARGEETDRIVGLELGADDYLAKPCSPRELTARVRAVLRRSLAEPNRGYESWCFSFEGWTLDTRKRELIDARKVVIDLSTSEYDLLLSFVEAPQRVLSREHLLDAARNRIATGFDRAIDVQVSRLRRKLASCPGGEDIIKTVRGAGYLFSPEVRRT